MIEQKKIEDNCDHRDFNELYSFDDRYYIRRGYKMNGYVQSL